MRTTATANRRGPWSRLVSLEVSVELPRGDLLLIALPLHLLRLDETFEEVDTQRIAHHFVLAEVLQRLGERGGEVAELVSGEALGIERVEVLFDRWRQGEFLANPGEAGVEHGGEGEVRIAGGIRGPELDPDGRAIAAAGAWHADQGGTVHLRPADRDRCLEAGDEALVRVHQRRHQRAECARMGELAGDEMLSDRRQLVLVGPVVECVAVLAGLGQDLVRMHSRPCHAEDRLGHERGQQSAALGDRFDRMFERDQLVGALQRITEGQVQFVLSGRNLVMARLDHDPQTIERAHDLLPNVAADVNRMVEVAGAVVPPRSHAASRGVGVQEKELQFHRDRVVEAEGSRLGLGSRQNAAWVAGEALAPRRHEGADAPSPWRTLGLADRQGVEIRAEEHVALEESRETLYGRAVEPFAVAHGMRQPLDWDCDALYRPEHVDKAKIQEADRSLGEPFQRALDRLRGRAARGRFSLRRRALLWA